MVNGAVIHQLKHLHIVRLNNVQYTHCIHTTDKHVLYTLAMRLTSISIILSANKIQNGDTLVPADPGPAGKNGC